MPQFYFHLWREGQLTPDEMGVALPTLDAAKRRGESMALIIHGQEACALCTLPGWDIEVIDETGQSVFTIPISDGQQSLSMKQAA